MSGVFILLGLIIVITLIILKVCFNVHVLSAIFGTLGAGTSKEQTIADLLLVVFFCLSLVGLLFFLLPGLQNIRSLFAQIGNIMWPIMFTIGSFLMPLLTGFGGTMSNTNSSTSKWPAIVTMVCGLAAFYQGSKSSYMETYNLSFEKMKIMILFFCFIALLINFIFINPAFFSSLFGANETYLFYPLLLSFFAFLYLVATFADSGSTNGPTHGSSLNSFGTYGTAAFSLFLLVTVILLSVYYAVLFQDPIKASVVAILLFLVILLWGLLIYVYGVNSSTTNNNNSNYTSANTSANANTFFQQAVLVLLGLATSGTFLYWLISSILSLMSKKESVQQFLVGIVILCVVGVLLYKTMVVTLPSETGNYRKNAFFSLIQSTLLYIPCLLSGACSSAANEYNGTSKQALLFFLGAAMVGGLYWKSDTIWSFIRSFGSSTRQTLVGDEPLPLNEQHTIGTYDQLQGKTQTNTNTGTNTGTNGEQGFDYTYAISSWIYVDAQGDNNSIDKYTCLLNFGEKPGVYYNPRRGKLRITMELREESKTWHYDTKDMLLQKWNNVVINYTGGTLDIFLNGQLIKSRPGIVPYYTYDALTTGETDGLLGGIKNVVYFQRELTSHNIWYLYQLGQIG